MFKRDTLINSINGKTDSQYSLFKMFPIHFHKGECTRGVILSVTFALLLCFAISLEADMVYGRVYGAEGKFKGGDKITLTNKEDETPYNVETDKYKRYSIFLPPGIYEVKFVKDNETWTAEIRSVTEPLRQDIYLKKAR